MALRPQTRARARALQLLYAWDTDGHPALQQLRPGVEGITRAAPDVAAEAAEVARGVIARCGEIDAACGRAAEHWRLERLAVVDRNILRIGVYELLEQRVPPKVAIDEALWLAHRFGGEQSPGFVNGVLDAVARGLGRL
jgi:transcription antitermination protein NusB